MKTLTYILSALLFVSVTHENSAQTIRESMEKTAAKGKKTAVVLQPSNIVFVAKTGSPAICSASGGAPVNVSNAYQEVAKTVAEIFKSEFQNESVEWVDYLSIPEMSQITLSASADQRDWWKTDYETIAFVNLTLTYDPRVSDMSTRLLVNMSLSVKQVKEGGKSMIELESVPYLGYATSAYQPHSTCLSSPEHAVEMLDPDKLVGQSANAAREKLLKYIEKENKKYEKAMKKKK